RWRASGGRTAAPETPTTRSPAPTAKAISVVSALRHTMRCGWGAGGVPYTRAQRVWGNRGRLPPPPPGRPKAVAAGRRPFETIGEGAKGRRPSTNRGRREVPNISVGLGRDRSPTLRGCRLGGAVTRPQAVGHEALGRQGAAARDDPVAH